MTNADDFCQFARLGQTVKIQKCLQSHSVDVNALNLYGESALSTATCHNQILCVEYLLASKADPKLRLTAGHTAIHIACRLGNVPILHMLLSIKKENNTEEEQQREDKHVYECLKMKDFSNRTPIHWAATQESVSKRQKMFAYLDKRMPGVLDSRYNLNWFNSWAATHPWVIDQSTTYVPIGSAPKLTSPNRTYQQDESSDMNSLDITPKVSINNYERTPRAPLTTAPINSTNKSAIRQRVPTEQPPAVLPSTPISSCKVTVTSIYHIPKSDQQPTSKLSEHHEPPVNDQLLSPLANRCTYRAHRVRIEPKIDFPPPPSDLDDIENKIHDYEDTNTPLSSKRPSHNLLSNIFPSGATTPSTDQSSQQSTKHIASSFGFDTSIEPRHLADTTMHSTTDTYAQNDELESVSSNDDESQSNKIDYVCKSTSTIDLASPGAHTYYA
ncbi:unnamed protein product [Adineta ricciae]|uniref:Uncharacterized protein n=1 Tax=Adineta ricciae TaxID=249248 RepID=A0A813XW84_ADIRI|nr:unnamed protein product [Adineta ricciae]CAF1101125.1 unnamed protein product [Adineta ricciae]